MRNVLLALVSMLAIVSCRDSANIYVSDELPPIWPDYTSVTIPINIAPLEIGRAHV